MDRATLNQGQNKELRALGRPRTISNTGLRPGKRGDVSLQPGTRGGVLVNRSSHSACAGLPAGGRAQFTRHRESHMALCGHTEECVPITLESK